MRPAADELGNLVGVSVFFSLGLQECKVGTGAIATAPLHNVGSVATDCSEA